MVLAQKQIPKLALPDVMGYRRLQPYLSSSSNGHHINVLGHGPHPAEDPLCIDSLLGRLVMQTFTRLVRLEMSPRPMHDTFQHSARLASASLMMFPAYMAKLKCTMPAYPTPCCCTQITLEEVNMNLTLEENGIGEGLNSGEMGLSTAYTPVLCLYWCDDLTIA